jgi:nucleoside-triphosphatase
MPIGYLVPTPLEPHSPIHILLLTGAPGIGKTTIIKNVAERFKGKRLGGFYTEEVREHGERRGFRLVIFDGQARVIAHVDFPRAHCVGRYGVDVAALDEAVGPALVLDNAVAVYLVDEIGKMECLSVRFIVAMRALLKSPMTLVATVALKGSGFIAEVKQRKDSLLWEVTRENRDELPARILAWLDRRGLSE